MKTTEAFKYCLICGTKAKKDGLALNCSNCGYKFYINSIPVVSAIILNEKKDKVLLITRDIEPKFGLLDFPGGFVDYGENFEQALAREVKEEVNAKVLTTKYFRTFNNDYLYKKFEDNTVGITYLVTIEDYTVLSAEDETSALSFYYLNELSENQLAFPHTKDTVKKLKTLNIKSLI